MEEVERVSAQPIRSLLRKVSLDRANDVDQLFDELAPVCDLHRDEGRILFRAVSDTPNVIRIGLKCTVRLQAHAYAAAIVLARISRPEFPGMSPEYRSRLLSPASQLLTWAVAGDLQPCLRKREGFERELDQILEGAARELPQHLFSSLSEDEVIIGEGLFRYALSSILLHELRHLKLAHKGCEGSESIERENEADRFAGEWLVEAASSSAEGVKIHRLQALLGIAVGLLWKTVFNVYLGEKLTNTHPQAYDRLFSVLNQFVDPDDASEYLTVWGCVSMFLFAHMCNAGFKFDSTDDEQFWADPRDLANHLIDRISREDRD